MELRRILLRVLLAALALAALAGVVGVVTAAGNTIWRIVGTASATAGAVAILLPFSSMMDKHKWRAGGLGGMVWTVVCYVLVIGLIWDFELLGWHWEATAWTLVAWTLCGLPAILLLTLSAIPETRLAARAGVFLATATFGLLMLSLPVSFLSDWSTSNKMWVSGSVLGGLAILAVANLVHGGTNDRRWWRWVGVAAACAAYIVAVTGIWQETDSYVGRQILTLLVSLSGVLALTNLAMLAPLAGQQHLVRWGTIAAAAVCAGAINMLIATEHSPDEDLWGRLATGSGIVAGCGSLALLVLARINRRFEYRPEEGSMLMTDIGLTCPRCNKSQKIALGGAACRTCGLRIEVAIEDPRCPKCGYLLYMLQSPCCPECGTVIAAQPQAPTVEPGR